MWVLVALLVTSVGVESPEVGAPEDGLVIEGNPCESPEISGVVNCDVADGRAVPYLVAGHRLEASAAANQACGVQAAIILCGVAGHVIVTNINFDGVSGPLISSRESHITLRDLELVSGGAAALRVDGGEVTLENVVVEGIAQPLISGHGTLSATNLTIAGQGRELVSWTGDATLRDLDASLLLVRAGSSSLQDQNVSTDLQVVWRHKGGHLDLDGGRVSFLSHAFSIGSEGTAQIRHVSFVGQPGSVAVNHVLANPICGVKVHYNDISRAEVRGSSRCTIDARFNWWQSTEGPATSPYAVVDPWLGRSFDALPTIDIEAVPREGQVELVIRVDGEANVIEVAGAKVFAMPADELVRVAVEHSAGLVARACAQGDCSAWQEVPAVEPLTSTQVPVKRDTSWWWLSVPVLVGAVVLRRGTLARVERRVRRKLQVTIAEERHARQEIEQWMASAAHDLKGPAANLASLMEVAAKRQKDGRDVGGVLDMGQGAQRQLRRTVDGIVGLAQAGHMEVTPSSLPVRQTLEEVVAALDVKDCRVMLNGPDVEFRTDHHLLARLVQNLLLNAVAADGRATVGVHWWDRKGLEISIVDNGPGIQAADEPAGAASPSMGLSIARRIADRLGGTLALEASNAHGTHWKLRLPNLG